MNRPISRRAVAVGDIAATRQDPIDRWSEVRDGLGEVFADTVLIEMLDDEGCSIFGRIEQRVTLI